MLNATLPLESIAEQSRADKSNRGKTRVLVLDEAPAMVHEEAGSSFAWHVTGYLHWRS